MLKGKTVVIGVSGGIAVYKVCDVVSRLKKLNANVHVIMTKGACEFVAPLTFQTMSQNYVVSDMFQDPKTWDVEHISLAKRADLFFYTYKSFAILISFNDRTHVIFCPFFSFIECIKS